MKKTVLFVICLLIVQITKAQKESPIDEVFTKIKVHSMISKGNNSPDFNYIKDSADLFLFSLHESIPIDDFKKKTNFGDKKVEEIISLLEQKNWLHKIKGAYKPSIFIANAEDGKLLYDYAYPISRDITKSIKHNLPRIKKAFYKTYISKTQTFEDWSFLILSNVILDNWQIDHVEREFLKLLNRPNRHGKNYFYAILENTNIEREAFGIYGNQMSATKGKVKSVYGNNRNNQKFSDYKTVSVEDNEIFEEIARLFLPDLLKVLEKHRVYAEDVYKKLGYSDEINFEEFFIWWYHFIYTQSTEEMNQKGILHIPQNGSFEYELPQNS